MAGFSNYLQIAPYLNEWIWAIGLADVNPGIWSDDITLSVFASQEEREKAQIR